MTFWSWLNSRTNGHVWTILRQPLAFFYAFVCNNVVQSALKHSSRLTIFLHKRHVKKLRLFSLYSSSLSTAGCQNVGLQASLILFSKQNNQLNLSTHKLDLWVKFCLFMTFFTNSMLLLMMEWHLERDEQLMVIQKDNLFFQELGESVLHCCIYAR